MLALPLRIAQISVDIASLHSLHPRALDTNNNRPDIIKTEINSSDKAELDNLLSNEWSVSHIGEGAILHLIFHNDNLKYYFILDFVSV